MTNFQKDEVRFFLFFIFFLNKTITFCHQKHFFIEIIHGDMALRNCLIDVQAWHCAISDLGLARREGTEPVANTLAVRWSAPELLLKQSENVGARLFFN